MEKIFTNSTVLIVPGLRDHVEEHWQTLLASKLQKVRTVPPAEINQLNCTNRVARIQAELEQIQGPVILVAHSAGVLMTVHWAAQYQAKIQGALLAAPPDLSQQWPENYPSSDVLRQEGWDPLPDQKLPFPSIVVASTNDHLASFESVAYLAAVWGSDLVNAGAVGHLNPASGFGEWPLAEELILKLDQTDNKNYVDNMQSA
ncbi:alpha/beta hydrolase [Acinetobacter sp. ANC 4945]|uniref:Alpha/beta hydrolase n=1 Tax=Acinetobacter amyesii TaxID=2942470 RepID=A0A1T1GXZ8_9GAMM|nr:alpha/beta hydrolase [Acinetobacter amyesii]MCL6246541.1 alpha/beta hydrolase [Acinetobacter amyesii]OOV82502.1 alpha/beta hydrolase [Acinetobacter amyesii]